MPLPNRALLSLLALFATSQTTFAANNLLDMTDADRKTMITNTEAAVTILLEKSVNTLEVAAAARPTPAQEAAVLDAIHVVATFHHAPATPVLAKLVDFTKSSPFRGAASASIHGLSGYPATEALIAIGTPSVQTLREQLGHEDDSLRISLMGKGPATAELQRWLSYANDPATRQFRNFTTILKYIEDQRE